MQIKHATGETCSQATGLVVVIDVIRAFTTATVAFEAGVTEIYLVSKVEQAFALKSRLPDSLIMGEVKGLPPEGFDYGNSPSALVGLDLRGRRMIQRTSAGTQGVVLSEQADIILTASFACAQATVNYIHSLAPARVTLVNTGHRPWEDGWGDEDAACADYLAALLLGQQPDPAPFLERVRQSRSGSMILQANRPEFPVADINWATKLDRVGFAMRVERRKDLLVMKPV